MHIRPTRRRSTLVGAIVTVSIAALTGTITSAASGAPVQADQVSAGSSHTCAIKAGAATCWGSNTSGQLGNGTTDDASIPASVTGLTSGVTAISAGDGSTCAIVSGAAECWGENNSGQLGDGTTNDSHVPVQVVGLTAGVTAISVGYGHTCAVASGAAKCWGSQMTFFGALGNGVDANNDGNYDNSSVPVQVTGLTTGVTSISAGLADSCAVVSGAAKCWGSQFWGQLGNGIFGDQAGNFVSSPTPVPVAGLSSGTTQIASGYEHNCAVAASSAKCWGEGNFSSALGDGALTNRSTPVTPTDLISGVSKVDEGASNTCALVSSNLNCWGHNYRGQLGDGSYDDAYEPVPVSLGGIVSDFSVGESHICAVVDGYVWCWGSDWSGEVGDGLGEYERDVKNPAQVVDTIPPQPEGPVIVVQSPLEGQAISSWSLTVSFTATADTAVTTQCQLDDADLVPCTSPWSLPGLTSGAHVVRIYAADALNVESMLEVNFIVSVPVAPPSGGAGQQTPPSKPVLEKLPKSIKLSKGITLHVTCATGCTINSSLKIGAKKIKLPAIHVPAASTGAAVKVKLSKKIAQQVKKAISKKIKVTFSAGLRGASTGDVTGTRLK